MAHDDSASSQSLERGLAILGAFTPDRPALGISELAQRLDLTRNTAHRYVATLDQAEAAAGGRVQPGDVPPGETDLAGARGQIAGDEAEQAGLASPVRPHYPDGFPGANRETEIFRDGDAAEPLRHVVELKEWTSHAF
jgi:hypothetical protein